MRKPARGVGSCRANRCRTVRRLHRRIISLRTRATPMATTRKASISTLPTRRGSAVADLRSQLDRNVNGAAWDGRGDALWVATPDKAHGALWYWPLHGHLTRIDLGAAQPAGLGEQHQERRICIHCVFGDAPDRDLSTLLRRRASRSRSPMRTASSQRPAWRARSRSIGIRPRATSPKTACSSIRCTTKAAKRR